MKKPHIVLLAFLCLIAGLAEAAGQSVGTTAVQLNTATFTSLGAAPQLVQALGGSIVVIVADNQPSPTAVGNSLTTSMAPQTFVQADSSSVIWARGLTGQAQAVVTPNFANGPPVYLSAGIYSAATVGTSDSTILSASAASHFLDLRNNSSTATVCINFGSTATISGTTCASGEIYLPPGWRQSWGAGDAIPQDAVHAIASAASTPASVGAK